MALAEASLGWDDVQTTAGSWKTMASIKAPANQMLAIRSVALACDGISGDAVPVGVRFARVTADSGTGTNTNPVKTNDALTLTLQGAGRTNFTAEPTVGNTLYPLKFHPQGGLIRETTFSNFAVKEGNELALQVKVNTGQTQVLCSGHIIYEE